MSDPDVSSLLTVAQAIEIIDAATVTPRVRRVSLSDAAGLRLAQDLVTDRDFPPFDKSQMDGFALRRADIAAAPAELRIVGEVAAGRSADRAIGAGETMAVMTGAPVPAGADCVVPVENTQRLGDEVVRILESASSGRFIARRGSDRPAQSIVLRRGTKLGAAQIAVAASVGAADVEIFDRPRVAVMTTGDELVSVDQTPSSTQIRETNGPMLLALLRRLGCDASDLGIVRDDFEIVRARTERAMREHDVLFISGGMSMGEYDFVPKALQALGVELKITKLRIKPGKPFVFGVDPRGRFVFGLPGNPVSAFVCTIRLAARLLERLCGGRGADAEYWVMGTLAKPQATNGVREFYQPAVYDGRAGTITPLEWKGSADIFTLAEANALLVRGEIEPALPAGALVRALEVPV